MPTDESITKQEIVIIRPSQKNDVLNDTDYDITKFLSRQGHNVVYFEAKIKEPNRIKED